MGAQRKQKKNRQNRNQNQRQEQNLQVVSGSGSPAGLSQSDAAEAPATNSVESSVGNSAPRLVYSDSAPAQAPATNQWQTSEFARVLDEVQHSAPEAHEMERRWNSDSKGRDRRVIPRVTSPAMRNHFQNITYVARFGTTIAALYLIGLFASALSQGKMALGRFIFYAVVISVMTISIQRFNAAIRSYLNSESQEKLVAVAERTFLMMFMLTAIGTIMAAVHLITLF